ncbi:helix-turn-helix domain-containing protein [Sulfitobacter sp. S190]|uniref:helix-turn-helix domain-containing protein n=1 Tax=Sulfitobacter sp. S190 TaxID=2867022 RepID=UPI0021A27729|nr:helix-turn-helix domain-containing protein [Sulfitobacter sp. S190]UWR21836.1 helix-turn-helix domain-containing protein [Sulfitobacter sp. S190]
MYVTTPTEFAETYCVTPLQSARTQAAAAHLKSGACLYFEGDEVVWLYQVTSGVLRLSRMLADGRRQVIAFGYPGDVLGFPSDGLHHADCEALTDAVLQPVRRAHLETGDGDPALHTALLQAALREISAMQDHFMMLGRKSASEKLASFLCVLAERVGEQRGTCKQITLPMSRSDIADFLGLTTETVSRTFTQLRKSRIIAIENNNTIIIRRADALFHLSLTEAD